MIYWTCQIMSDNGGERGEALDFTKKVPKVTASKGSKISTRKRLCAPISTLSGGVSIDAPMRQAWHAPNSWHELSLWCFLLNFCGFEDAFFEQMSLSETICEWFCRKLSWWCEELLAKLLGATGKLRLWAKARLSSAKMHNTLITTENGLLVPIISQKLSLLRKLFSSFVFFAR